MEEAEGGKFCKFFMMSPVKKKSFAKWQWHLLNRCYTKSARKGEKICWKRQNINKWCTKIMKDKDDLTGFFMVFSPWSSEILLSMVQPKLQNLLMFSKTSMAYFKLGKRSFCPRNLYNRGYSVHFSNFLIVMRRLSFETEAFVVNLWLIWESVWDWHVTCFRI